MSDEYKAVKGGTLKLKGGKKSLFKTDKKKKDKLRKSEQGTTDLDAELHGWWKITDEVDLTGGEHIAFECGNGNRRYLSALDNGRFTIGLPHPERSEPNPEEVFAVVKTPDDPKASFKTGYGKYIGVDTDGSLVATAEAIGQRERFQVVFEEGKSAVQAVCNQLFLSMSDNKDGLIYVASKKATEQEMVNIRTKAQKTGPVDWRALEDRKSAKDCSQAYVKMYQHSKVDIKCRNIPQEVFDLKSVKRAQRDGDLHETLLSKRIKMKSDRYC
ncbi:FRG1-like family protein [Dictyocaulus viviparus]|uniref:FRG1-like family protein n=1 Tax=Dictyocaulus viviparus TaxID=29172 RepID=A0A0D8XN99_DICVI|nr:FRG1-like family protein [Dictyocaulus viviparus]